MRSRGPKHHYRAIARGVKPAMSASHTNGNRPTSPKLRSALFTLSPFAVSHFAATLPIVEEGTLSAIGDNRRLRVGLAGLGRFGKLHAAVLAHLPGVELTALCDPLAAALEESGERYGVPANNRFTEFVTMLDDSVPALDAVFIVTPEPLHAEQAHAALERGLAVFLEKPLATSPEDGTRLLAAASGAGLPLQTGFLLRFDVQLAALKHQVDAGTLGELVTLRAKRNVSRAWFPAYGDRAHPVHETTIHDIDLFLWLTGRHCERVYAVERRLSGLRYPDVCVALLHFTGGAIGIVETSWLAPAASPANIMAGTWHGTIDAELEVVGTAGTARLRMLEGGLSIWTDKLLAQPDAGLWPDVHGQIGGALRAEVEHFVDRVRTGQPSTVASEHQALEGLHIAEAIITSAAEGHEVRLEEPSGTAHQPDRNRH